MSLPAPNLDDRRFQDLVDDAKRLVQQRTQRWTDHNVSDPGVTLIEAFAWITDQMLYRLNRVPELNYIKFLDLIGVRLFPPTGATAPVTFWLSAPQPEHRHDPGRHGGRHRPHGHHSRRSSSARRRTGRSLPSSLQNVASMIGPSAVRDHGDALAIRSGFFCFDSPPKPGDVLLVGLTEAVPGVCGQPALQLPIEGVGVDPDQPAAVWEAWTGEDWVRVRSR